MTDAPSTAALHDTVATTVAVRSDELLALSHAIHARPELAFAEHHASSLVAERLTDAGFDVTVGVHGLDTALRATYGSGDMNAVICVEYDALPGVGHACGHNIIAAAGVGAAIAAADVADELGIRVTVLGTPAEEHGGGKVLMLADGAWDDATFSLMVHPYPADTWPTTTRMQAVHRLVVTFTGQGAHAAAAPDQARNAADAATIALVAVGLLRQQVRDGARLNAIITEAGLVTNIIADRAVVEIEVREATLDALQTLEGRVLACFEGAAIAAGVSWSVDESEPLYADLVQDEDLVEVFAGHLSARGRTLDRTAPPRSGGSTDMGNVSQVVPSIHPVVGVEGARGPIHTAEFAEAAGGPAGDRAVLDAAVALASTIVDAARDPRLRARLVDAQTERVRERAAAPGLRAEGRAGSSASSAAGSHGAVGAHGAAGAASAAGTSAEVSTLEPLEPEVRA